MSFWWPAANLAIVDIPAGKLSAGLTMLGQQADIDILFSDAVVGELRNRPIRGIVEVRNALRQLLAGTGLAFRETADGTFVIVDPRTR